MIASASARYSASCGFFGGPGHDELGDIAENRRFDRGLIKKVGDQHSEAFSHRSLRPRAVRHSVIGAVNLLEFSEPVQ